MSDNLSNLLGRKGLKNNLFDKFNEQPDILHTEVEMEKLAEEFLVGKANVFGTASFYDFLKLENKDKLVYVCNGTSCVCSGTQEEVKSKLKTVFYEQEIGHMTCLGRCHENGAFHLNGKNYSGDSIHSIEDVYKNDTVAEENYSIGGNEELLTKTDTGLDQFRGEVSLVLSKSKAEVLDHVLKSNLRGRGGAGFPMGIKLQAAAQENSEVKFIICNADEGDPGAYSDRYLLEKQPFKVLFGMMVAGYVTGAKYGILYIRAEYPDSSQIIQNHIDLLKKEGLVGENILQMGFEFEFKIIRAQGAYICGEETALINSIEGQRPEVRTRPPFPTQKGLFNKPTVVNNVETLAALYPIFKYDKKFEKVGTKQSVGSKLVSLDSSFNNPGIFEIKMGTPIENIIQNYGKGFKYPLKAIQIGGPLGGVVPVNKLKELTLDFESFKNEGFLLGHASFVGIPESFSMVNFMEHLLDFAQYESCGKCFPCRLGTKRGHELLKNALSKKEKINIELFNDLLFTLQTGSLCAHGGGIPLPLKNIMTYFSDEVDTIFE